MPPIQRPITRLLITNRGEIAVRILQSCHELPRSSPDQPPLTTYALYTESDTTHISLGRPHHALLLPSAGSYMDIDYLIKLAKENEIDAVHPGYGFLSENAEFVRRMWEEAGVMVVGPGWEVLAVTGDKLAAKQLAVECEVPVLKAMERPCSDVNGVREFVRQVGFPVMVKAVDGGGGRGIRLVEHEGQLQSAVERCVGESPSKMVFAEQAAVNGFKHIEVQIVGDGRGGVKHLWERDCSVQRRFQKIVEVAPAPPVGSRRIVAKVIDAAIRMARRLKYLGLGTWEFLVNLKQRKFYFLEINPRLQVEHTITECLTGVDLVREQLLYAQGLQDREDLRLGEWWEAKKPPPVVSIQLRLCAESPDSDFALSIGKVTDVRFPSGNGVRVDSHLSRGGVVGSDFDNLMAKIIVTASTFQDCVVKAQRALAETEVVGVQTNLSLLRAVVANDAFQAGVVDTRWLEANMESLIARGKEITKDIDAATAALPHLSLTSFSSTAAGSSTSVAFRKGDSWSLVLEQKDQLTGVKPAPHHLRIDKISRNEFPEALTADVSFTAPGTSPLTYKMSMKSTTLSTDAASSTHRRGDPNNKSHILLPMSGKLMEILVEEGDEIQENQVIGFVKQMKMELEIRSPRAGVISWAIELENDEGDDVAEGILLAELKDSQTDRLELRSKL